MKQKYMTQIALMLATLCISASALAQWVWLDEHGVKQYTDIAPPANVPQNHILKQPRGTAPAAKSDAPEDKPADAATDTKGPMTTADKEADYKKRKLDQAEKDKKAAEKAKHEQENAENCARTKAYLGSLNSGQRISTTESNGDRGFMTDDDRAKETARAQEMLDSCNK